MYYSLFDHVKYSVYKVAFWPLEMLAYHMWTVFLFMKSDVKTVLIPMGLFAICNTPNAPHTRFAPSLFWVFIHLLEFDLANQTLDPAEDAQNKPYRPIPAGRISLETARTLRWSLYIFNTLWSAYCSIEVLAASFFCSLVAYVYNDLGCLGDGQWTHRNLTLAFFYLSFELGACLAKGNNTTITPDALLSIACNFGLFITTSHAQDFKDVIGDKLVGKHTFPIEYPTASRIAMFTAVFWSVLLTSIWQHSISILVAAVFNLVGLAVALRFWGKRRIKADQRSYYLYCTWFTMALCLPGIHRLSDLRVF